MKVPSYSKYDELEEHYQMSPTVDEVPMYGRINGVVLPPYSEPRFVAFPSKCPFCSSFLSQKEAEAISNYQGRSHMWLMECDDCGFWEISENRWPSSPKMHREVLRGYSVAGKVMEYEVGSTTVPIEDLCRYLKKNPSRFQYISPASLEQLVARCFRAGGEYVDVLHVGRSHDGGVDVILVHDDRRKILVQVKRRGPSKMEPVTTLRNLLGTLVVQGAMQGIIVSTADHFSYCAENERLQAELRGYFVEFKDVGKLREMVDVAEVDCSWRSLSRPCRLISEARHRFSLS